MNIYEIIEGTIGSRRIVKLVLYLPFVPKIWFLAEKFRYFERNKMDIEAAAYIKLVLRKPRISTALNLHNIMYSFDSTLRMDTTTVEKIRELKHLLLTWKPRTSKHAYKKVFTLAKCFEFEQARRALDAHKNLLSEQQINELYKYFDVSKDALDYFSQFTADAWANSLCFNSPKANANSNTAGQQKITFYLPPSLSRVEIGIKDVGLTLIQVNDFFMHFHKLIPRETFDVHEKLQFNWRSVREQVDSGIVVSYHTKGDKSRSIRVKESAFANYITADSTGFSGWHSATNLDLETFDKYLKSTSANEIEHTFQTLHQELVQANVSKYRQSNNSDSQLKDNDDFYFVALQVARDVVAELAYIDTYNLLRSVMDISRQHSINLVIKRHPRCNSFRIRRLLKTAQGLRGITISDESIHTILPKCKAVITVNSGVGMEALLHLKDVICTGKAEYSFIAKTARTKAELEYLMLNHTPTGPEKIKQFLHYYATEHLYRFDDISKIQNFWKRQAHSSEVYRSRNHCPVE